ncbi:hypothetical protein FQN49_005242 [Arthroderma sp. PD_2]|nr:hypothetical protein FQN49_005242 [Arthroderma sp. PD_2]
MDPDRVVKVEDVDIEEETYISKPVMVDRRRRLKAKRPFRPVRSTISALLRLFVWYSVFTALFRCPSSISELDEQSPRVCKPYLVARTHLEPHVAPYYHKYGEPYVEKLQPYAQSFYEKAEKVYTPTAQFSKDIYQGYASVYVERGAELAKQQWSERVSPHIDFLQKQATDYYASSVAPHVKSAQSIIIPQFRVAAAQSVIVKDNYLIPSYNRARPVAERAYAAVDNCIVSTITPYTQKAWSAIFLFLNGTVRTHITHLYSENVEPQLVKIGAKLASYREGRTIQHLNLETASSTVEEPTSAPEPATKSSIESKTTQVSSSVEPATTTKLTPAQQSEQAREIISTDLRTWQERSAASVEKEREYIQEQVQQVVGRVYNDEKRPADELLSELERVVERELDGLKTGLYTIVQSIPEEYTLEDEEKAQNEFLQALKQSSLAIRDAAHYIRVWFNDYTDKLTGSLTKSIETTLDIIDNARNLGLQEIGMRWALMDGVTYADWANFHGLKTKLVEWKDEARQAGLQHDNYLAAKDFADAVVARGMDMAQNAAQQLSELKAIGKLKIEARDMSENLDVNHINAEMIKERRKYLITSVTPTPTPSETPDFSGPPAPSDTEVVQSESEPSACASSVAESLEAEVETPQADSNGEHPKAAFFDEEPTPSDASPAMEPTPEALVLEETPTTETPSESSPNPTSTASIDEESMSSLASEKLNSDLSDASDSYSDKMQDSIGKEQDQLQAADEYHEATMQASELYSSTLDSISPSSTASIDPSSVPHKVDGDSVDSSSTESTSESASSTPFTEAIGVDEIIGSATDEFSSLLDSAKAGLEEKTPIPSDEVDSLMEDASTKLDKVLSSAQSSISSLPAATPSASVSGDKHRESVDSEIARLTAALQAAQARLLELSEPAAASIPEQEAESEDTTPSASAHSDDI